MIATTDISAPAGTENRGRLSAALKVAARHALDFVLPPQCLACRARIAAHPGLCSDCWMELDLIERPLCERTGQPFAYDPGPGIVSAAALAKPPPWDRARAATAFGPVARDLVHALKYRDRLEAGALLASLMASAGRDLLADADLIVPVPLYRTRLWMRRYNQAALLAQAISRRSGVRCVPDLLARKRATRSQVGLNTKDRARNVRGAFALGRGAEAQVAGRHVLLVDDVITTGATARACTRALIDGGADHVDVLAFSLVSNPLRVDM